MKKSKNPSRNADLEFTWITRDLGPQYQIWQDLATRWLKTQDVGLPVRIQAIQCFVEGYIHRLNLPIDPANLLHRGTQVPEFYASACPQSAGGIGYNNALIPFLTWVLETHFSEKDDYGRVVISPDFYNPLPYLSRKGAGRPIESVRSALPYRFIQELRRILAPAEHFRDWVWAQNAVGTRNGQLLGGDWIIVDENLIDPADADCVWRRRTTKGGTEIVEIWSPVRSVALLVKLMLPLRTYQVRMLDSGEADTWRYTKAGWVKNDGPLASGSDTRPTTNGIFRRVYDQNRGEERTSLYINTNKTADTNRPQHALGYTIPWQYEELLYWLEKLRNWQEKYNPIAEPIPWTELEIKHLKHAKAPQQLAGRPKTCFLFRDPTSKLPEDRAKPIRDMSLTYLWCKLLKELEERCAAREEGLASGKPLQFVYPNSHTGTPYPLHSLRVSLLTCLALDAEVPLVILSKLVAGHSRLVMTLYYTKVGVTHMTQVLDAATRKLGETSSIAFQRFLQETEYSTLLEQVVSNNTEGLLAALPNRPEERNPAGWLPLHYGLCLVGGNTTPTEANSRIGGCFNGGERLRENKYDPTMNTNAPVPGGARNCVRCRWFITEPRYVDALRAHFNTTSYHLAESAKQARIHEEALDDLKTRRYAAEREQKPFTDEAEYLKRERLWEAELARTDQLANDLLATYRLIKRCFDLIAMANDNADHQQQLVAVGSLQDLKIALEDTPSELLQIAGVCQDAEFYPDETPGKAVLRRSQFLDSALYREGIQPVFMTLSEHEQLQLGNRFLDCLANAASPHDTHMGMRKVIGVIESGRQLTELGLETDLADILEVELGRPIARLSDLALQTKRLVEHY